jgi:hypothetical protein
VADRRVTQTLVLAAVGLMLAVGYLGGRLQNVDEIARVEGEVHRLEREKDSIIPREWYEYRGAHCIYELIELLTNVSSGRRRVAPPHRLEARGMTASLAATRKSKSVPAKPNRPSAKTTTAKSNTKALDRSTESRSPVRAGRC